MSYHELEELPDWPIADLTREDKVDHYSWLVRWLTETLDAWRVAMSEPEKYGTFNEWEWCDAEGAIIAGSVDELIGLASEVDPEGVSTLCQIKDKLINIRVSNYEIMKRIHVIPDPPMPTPEEEAAAEAEKREAYRTGGANLLRKQATPEHNPAEC
jgi:hypothetical protein